MTEVWKPFLLTPPATECRTLPSPASLRKKILIKVKYVDPQKAALKAKSTQKDKSSSGSGSASEGEADTPEPATPELKQKKKKKSSITPALSALGIYTRAYHFSSLTAPEASNPTRTSHFPQSNHPFPLLPLPTCTHSKTSTNLIPHRCILPLRENSNGNPSLQHWPRPLLSQSPLPNAGLSLRHACPKR